MKVTSLFRGSIRAIDRFVFLFWRIWTIGLCVGQPEKHLGLALLNRSRARTYPRALRLFKSVGPRILYLVSKWPKSVSVVGSLTARFKCY